MALFIWAAHVKRSLVYILIRKWIFKNVILIGRYLAGYSAPDSFKMRLAGGAWCLAALLLTNYYSSVLTSLITTTTPVPIINSLEDAANNDNVDIMLVKGFGANVLLTVRKLLFLSCPGIETTKESFGTF